ncbi:hypothetical protein WR25_06820 [Diploscapter pachys]|uniref:Major facilitator superfamily (MFS) profile domain-containing protein n=1 Tax=Diploscapter pachys TaxID=2018661 RepID=A0A2A2LN24_9BILA|nr:hypothetical protein WR25_06820 [Diploscapter pachys]
MQGIYATAGCITQIFSPILAAALYKATGYKYIILLQLIFALISMALMIGYYKYMVPLKLKPKTGKPMTYKNGIFYVM